MREVIRERACRENETRTRDGEGRKSRGNARREALGTGVHAYATISFDYIIVFRPGGIIHVNKLHIFFSFPIPSPTRHFFVLPAAPLLSFYCRDFVVVANSRRLFDPLSRFPFARRDARDTSLVARFRIILSRTPERAKVCKVFRWGVGTNERRAEILNASGKMEDKCINGSFVMFHLDIEFSREFPVSR